MQSIINVLAVSSFLMSTVVVGSGLYIFKNKDILINSFKQDLMDNFLPGLTGLSEDLIPKDIPLPPNTDAG